MCYDLAASEDEQIGQICYWLKYLNSHLRMKIPSYDVILVGLRADKCEHLQASAELVSVESWKRKMPNLSIHHKTFQLSAHSDKASLVSMLEELEQLFGNLFKAVSLKVPSVYCSMLNSIRQSNKLLGGIDSIQVDSKRVSYNLQLQGATLRGLQYLHSIGEIILLPNVNYISDPARIASNMAMFVSPAKVRASLLIREPGSPVLLSEQDIGVIVNVTRDSERYFCL